MSNPDQESERKLLSQLAPELDEDLILRLVGAFQDLRKGYETGVLSYPYSLRGLNSINPPCLGIDRDGKSELINLVRHMRAYPTDSLGDALRNIFDFDIYKPEIIDQLAAILDHHGYDPSLSQCTAILRMNELLD